MIKLAIDEDFNNRILRGLLRRNPRVDAVRVQDAGPPGGDDPAILEWAAGQGRVLLTHYVTTMTRHALERVQAGLPMPGIFEVGQRTPIGQAVEEILLLTECGLEGEYEGRVIYLPLK
ncbi:MAG: DUF5615 family PIN-like protein [Acidobacteria bacterium]|nr:DUF5615 family PIN-like protein [Acidobacteriota bacterium]MCI0720016.1 DUF5615 family PIN-like protein [Acidobacteriota bacterium]